MIYLSNEDDDPITYLYKAYALVGQVWQTKIEFGRMKNPTEGAVSMLGAKGVPALVAVIGRNDKDPSDH